MEKNVESPVFSFPPAYQYVLGLPGLGGYKEEQGFVFQCVTSQKEEKTRRVDSKPEAILEVRRFGSFAHFWGKPPGGVDPMQKPRV